MKTDRKWLPKRDPRDLGVGLRSALVSGLLLGGQMFGATAANQALRFARGDQAVELPLGPSVAVDDSDPRFAESPPGVWSPAAAKGAFGGSARQTADPTAVATWTPVLPRAGRYEVLVWWGAPVPDGAIALADAAARYVVKHANGLAAVELDQQAASESWTSLGTFEFAGDRTECVVLRPGAGSGVWTLADAVRFENRDGFDGRDAMTVEAWVRIDGFRQSDRVIVAKGDAWALQRFGQTDRLTFRTRDGSQVQDLPSAGPLSLNAWHHVAAVWDGSEKRLYVDGVLSASAAYASAWPESLAPVRLGGDPEGRSGAFGRLELDQVRIWSVARDRDELEAGSTRNARGCEPGLLGEWRFDEWSPKSAMDSSRLAVHGRLLPAESPPARVAAPELAFEPPPPGPHALEFNGRDQYVAVTGANSLDLAEGFTVEAWVRLEFPPDREMVVLSKGPDAWELGVAATGKIVFRTAGLTTGDPTGAGQPDVELIGQSRLDAGEWRHIAATWAPGIGRKEILIDGRLDAALTDLSGTLAVNSTDLRLAARPAVSGGRLFFEGALDEVRVWARPRTARELAESSGRRLHGVERGLLARWSFDEGSGPLALDSGPRSSPANGVLVGRLEDYDRVAGVVLGDPLPLQYCLWLDGAEAHVQIVQATPWSPTSLTIEAWVKPQGTGFRPILTQGELGFGLAVDADDHLRYFVDETTQNSLRSDRPLEFERDSDGRAVLDAQGRPVLAWNHVAVVVDPSANRTAFFINGRLAGSYAASVIPIGPGALTLGKRGSGAAASYFDGFLDEVRLWNVPRTALELELYAFNPILATPPPDGLIGYWRLNEGGGTVVHEETGRQADGELIGASAAEWRDGTDWGVPAPPVGFAGLTPNPDAHGLWIGRVTLDRVNEVQRAVQGAADQVTPTADEAAIRILFHVSEDGQVRLLKDVILMRKAATTPSPSGSGPLPATDAAAPDESLLVLVTRPELIQDYEGVSRRGGKLVGLRYGSVAYDFEGYELPVLGGLGPGVGCLGRIHLPKDHPTNPYRHKYHPDHRSGFEIVRQFSIEFDGAPDDPFSTAPGYGVDRLTGVYRETVTGLHKVPLQVEGSVELNRISTVGVLNQ